MGDKRIMLVSWQLRYNMTNSSFELAAFLVSYFSFCQLILLVDRGLLILLMCLDWKISGLERPSNFKESVFQAIPFPLHVHPTYTSLVGKKLERAPEMRECHTQRHPEEIHWEEDNGRISSLQLMYCEYYLFWLGKNFHFCPCFNNVASPMDNAIPFFVYFILSPHSLILLGSSFISRASSVYFLCRLLKQLFIC